MQKGQAPILILVAIIIIAAVVGGAYYLGRSTTSKPQPVHQTSQPIPSPTPDETANWKTFVFSVSNPDSYSFKFPPQTEITEGGKYGVDGVFVESPSMISLVDGNMQFSINVEENKDGSTLERLRQEFDGQNPDEDIEGNKIQSFLLDGKPAIRGAAGGPKGKYKIISIYKDYIYRLTFEPDINQTGEQILSTIKFLEKNSDTIVKIFFNNKKLANDQDFIYCDKVFPLNRSIAYTKAVAVAALNEWLKGPTVEEKALGYLGGTNGDVSINSVKIIDGQAYIDLHFSGDNDSLVAARKYLSGTCGIASFLSQIGETVEQFSSVTMKKKTVFSIDGSQEYFNSLIINP